MPDGVVVVLTVRERDLLRDSATGEAIAVQTRLEELSYRTVQGVPPPHQSHIMALMVLILLLICEFLMSFFTLPLAFTPRTAWSDPGTTTTL